MLSDEVSDQLLGLLASGAWPNESRLPSEHELARRFAVSRPILRQALARLRAEGRVISRKGAGSYVREVGYRYCLVLGKMRHCWTRICRMPENNSATAWLPCRFAPIRVPYPMPSRRRPKNNRWIW